MNPDSFPTDRGISGYDWAELFPSADGWNDRSSTTFAAGVGGAQLDPVMPEDVLAVVAHHGISPEGYGSIDLWAIVQLQDGRYGMVEAWADTTGWGCQDGVVWKVCTSYDQAVSELSEVNRRELALQLAEREGAPLDWTEAWVGVPPTA